ncbi:MAG TPA: guanylate kinase [Candidatus Hydrogenedens sp.]|nr:guanylate kinase [Candidatus Hydrogenedens sp.]
MKKENLIIIVSAPSGVGKTTVIQYLMKQRDNLALSISATTRAPRHGEKHGVDYYFLSTEEFEEKIRNNEFVEYARVHDDLYGTLYSEIHRHLNSEKDLILELDIQGMRSIKNKFPKAVTIFMLPPSLKEMEFRLKNRGTESEEKIQKRLRRAFEEMKVRSEFDYTIVNYEVEQSAKDLNAIIHAEHLKSSRIEINLE